MDGSRFVKEPFDWHDQRFDTQERIMALQFGQVERRLERIEAMIEGLERRLWMTVYGVVAVILTGGAPSLEVDVPVLALPLDEDAAATLRANITAIRARQHVQAGEVQVATRSPTPARPLKVSRRPPSARPRRVISARPRVISAARALSPKPSPSHIPVAMAMTFLTAPPTSAPGKSSLA